MAYEPSSNDNENQSLRKINALSSDVEKDSSLSLGQFGAVYESGTTAIAGQSFGAIQVLADATFSSLTATDWSGDSLANLAVPAGMTIFGDFTGFTLSSGRVVAYKNA